jgi:PleD family two-component response regulator
MISALIAFIVLVLLVHAASTSNTTAAKNMGTKHDLTTNTSGEILFNDGQSDYVGNPVVKQHLQQRVLTDNQLNLLALQRLATRLAVANSLLPSDHITQLYGRGA